MKKLSLVLAVLCCAACGREVDYQKIETYQDHSVKPLEIAADSDTRVLMVFPHADDETVAAGLSQHLRQQGAVIHLLTLTNDYDSSRVDTRLAELECAGHKLGFQDVEVAGLINNTWEEVMSNEIRFWYDQQDSIKSIIKHKMERFQPDILITYDTEIGGYGHPEHYISAQLVEDLFYEFQGDSSYTPRTLIQSTLPDKLEQFLAGPVGSYELTCSITGSEGLPEPEAALDITSYWPVKNEAAHCYQSQMRTLSKFFMAYDERDAEAHIKAFSKEYYTIVQNE